MHLLKTHRRISYSPYVEQRGILDDNFENNWRVSLGWKELRLLADSLGFT